MEQCIPAPDDVESRLDDMALGAAINEFLSGLDAEKRNIFLRRYWFLDSIADISKRFALSQSKVKTTLFRCRSGLKKHLEKHGDRFELVYTRNEAGRRALLECRRAANEGRIRAKVTRARGI